MQSGKKGHVFNHPQKQLEKQKATSSLGWGQAGEDPLWVPSVKPLASPATISPSHPGKLPPWLSGLELTSNNSRCTGYISDAEKLVWKSLQFST